MFRPTFFYFLFLILLFSCKEKTTISSSDKAIKDEGYKVRNNAISKLEQKDFSTAFYYFNKSKTSFEKIKDSANISYVLIQMASIQQISGDYYGSKETLTEALPYIKKKDIYSASINNFFGIADKELSNYDDAIYYYNESIKDYNDSIFTKGPLNNIAVVYTWQKKYDKAIAILESISNKKINTNDEESLNTEARIRDNLGFAYFKKGLPEKGLQLMLEGYKIRKQTKDNYGGIENDLHLAEYYAQSDPQKSKQFALDAYKAATSLHSIDERLEALSFLMTNNSVSNNRQYGQKFVFLNDSIIKIRNNFKNKFAKIKYDSTKEKNENEKLRLEKTENLLKLEKANDQIILFVLGFISLLFLIIYLRKHYQDQNRIEKIKTAHDTETRIAKDIHDELANDVFHAIMFTQTQVLNTENNKDTLLQKLDHIYARVRGISRENNDLDTGSGYSANLKEMLSTYNNSNTNVLINNLEKINWETVDDIKKVTIQRVLQELMVNMKKHSHATVVVVKFDSNPKTVLIDYTDNGVGAENDKIIKNGLQNMENRIQAIKGTINFETEPQKGFKVKISMPK